MGEDLDIAPADIDYYDPEEDQATDNLEGEAEALPEDNDEEPALEAETAEEGEDNTEGEEAEGDPADDPEIDLGEGLVLPASELRSGYMRDRDYRQKTTELSQERQNVQQTKDFYAQQTQSVNSLLQETVQFLQGLVPEEPPLSLAQTDPQSFQYQKELRARTMQEIQGIVQRSQQGQQQVQQAQQFEQNQNFAQHLAGLERRFPHLKGDNKKVVEFIQRNRQVAMEDFGFTAQEVGQLTDDRILSALHYAAMGKKAEHNRNNAKRRLTQPKPGGGRPAQGAKGGSESKRAMQRLAQTGSLRDALAIDFE